MGAPTERLLKAGSRGDNVWISDQLKRTKYGFRIPFSGSGPVCDLGLFDSARHSTLIQT